MIFTGRAVCCTVPVKLQSFRKISSIYHLQILRWAQMVWNTQRLTMNKQVRMFHLIFNVYFQFVCLSLTLVRCIWTNCDVNFFSSIAPAKKNYWWWWCLKQNSLTEFYFKFLLIRMLRLSSWILDAWACGASIQSMKILHCYGYFNPKRLFLK